MRKVSFIISVSFIILCYSLRSDARLANSNIVIIKSNIKIINKYNINVNNLKISFNKKLSKRIGRCMSRKCYIIYNKKTMQLIDIKTFKSKNKHY